MSQFSEIVKSNLICVYCNGDLEKATFETTHITCPKCQQDYPVINNVPVIINESRSIFSFSDFQYQKNLFFDISKGGKFISRASKLLPGIGGNNLGKRNFKFLESLLTKDHTSYQPKVLVIGGSIIGDGMSDFVNSKKLILLESDVSFGPRTKIIFDAHMVPFKNESFDCVIAQAVLEHVIDPMQCVEEIYRVLKPNGIIYAETPFMQQVHGGAYDFTRFSKSGHRRLFRFFTEIQSGVTAGSGTALAWSFQYFLLSLFGYNNKLRLIIKILTRITCFWMKYFDYLTMLNIRDIDGASGFFFIGKKSTESMSGKELIDYYSKK